MTTYPIFPTVDSDTKLFPQPTMDALAGALPFVALENGVTATLTGDPNDPDLTLYMNGIEL